MASTTAESVARRYFELLQTGNFPPIRELLSPEILWRIPFSADGSLDIAYQFIGQDQAMGYVSSAESNFGTFTLKEQLWSVDEEKGIVVVRGVGDNVWLPSGQPYFNRYVFWIEVQDGLILGVDEYANPVTFELIRQTGQGADPAGHQ